VQGSTSSKLAVHTGHTFLQDWTFARTYNSLNDV
jgi:hypothetical protein